MSDRRPARRLPRRATAEELADERHPTPAADTVYGYSFILTDLAGDAVGVERHHRERAQIRRQAKFVRRMLLWPTIQTTRSTGDRPCPNPAPTTNPG